jgi:hypothetical protein
MARSRSPTIVTPLGRRRVGLEVPPTRNLFLHAGIWQAACASCGHVLAESRLQARAERLAARANCPICQDAA